MNGEELDKVKKFKHIESIISLSVKIKLEVSNEFSEWERKEDERLRLPVEK